MSQRRPVIHARDHSPGGADPAFHAWEDVGTGIAGAYPAGWTHLTPAASPPKRFDHSLAYDSYRNRVVLFGGFDATGAALQDTWEWDGTTWKQILTAHSPAPRANASMAFDPTGNKLLMYGGTPDGSTRMIDTNVFDGTDWVGVFPGSSPNAVVVSLATDYAHGTIVAWECDTGLTWLWDGSYWNLQSPASSPSDRLTTMTFDTASNRVMMGPGAGTSATAYHDVWTWDGTTWTQHVPTGLPTTTDSYGIAYSPNCGSVVMFGGEHYYQTYGNETWRWTGTDWTQYTGAAPGVRAGFPSNLTTNVNGTVLLFGGMLTPLSAGAGAANDTWMYACVGTGP